MYSKPFDSLGFHTTYMQYAQIITFRTHLYLNECLCWSICFISQRKVWKVLKCFSHICRFRSWLFRRWVFLRLEAFTNGSWFDQFELKVWRQFLRSSQEMYMCCCVACFSFSWKFIVYSMSIFCFTIADKKKKEIRLFHNNWSPWLNSRIVCNNTMCVMRRQMPSASKRVASGVKTHKHTDYEHQTSWFETPLTTKLFWRDDFEWILLWEA